MDSEGDAGGDDPSSPTLKTAPDEQFPRTSELPLQSPLYWVAEKDRYLRQPLIRDIEKQTGRALVVYFADTETADVNAQIHPSDDAFMAEVLRPVQGQPYDLLLETNGGYTDATEKMVAQLRSCNMDFRVIVPRRAKSNGTLVALASTQIVMGPASELGPIDPNVVLNPQQAVPAHFLLQIPNADPVLLQSALNAVMQTKKLATSLLQTGMMAADSAEVSNVVEQLATRNHFHSHGSVIDAAEATRLRLSVLSLGADHELWRRIWLLRCLYAHDIRKNGLVKVFEGARISNSLSSVGP